MTYTGEPTGSNSEWLQFLKFEASTDLTDVKNVWAWLQPEPTLKKILYTTLSSQVRMSPYILRIWRRPFSGHNFRLGGSKK